MAARAFERYVQDKARMAGVENDYLVNIRKAPEHNTDNTGLIRRMRNWMAVFVRHSITCSAP